MHTDDRPTITFTPPVQRPEITFTPPVTRPEIVFTPPTRPTQDTEQVEVPPRPEPWFDLN
jgi:hypothetical protein